jgi:TetR/AcrR family transcriptional regulator, tetracycline repressor protein
VSLSRTQIIDAAQEILTRHGLGGLTMRQLAKHVGVQPGALYYHVASKQDLLVGVAEHILNRSATAISANDPTQAALDLRAALLPIRDSADVISFANAFRPASLIPFRALEQLFSAQLPDQQARWAAQTLIHYVLGFVAHEQNQAELIRARIVTDASDRAASEQAFRFGVETILLGLSSPENADDSHYSPSTSGISRPGTI